MTTESNYNQRKTAIHLLRSGKSADEVAEELGQSRAWVYKWWQRYQENGVKGLKDQSRAPKNQPGKIAEHIKLRILEIRSELEIEAEMPGKLSYIGAHAIQGRLRQEGITRLPSISSIERILRAAGVTKPRKPAEEEIIYPHLQPQKTHELIQIDIVPRYLPGGPCVSCFNAIDVVSRYPTGEQFAQKRSNDAAEFLLHVWSTLGIPKYTQVDNEGCFSGGFTHRYVIGKVVRLALMVGTELVFSPFYHPKSNGHIERFHQDYTKNVWNKSDLPNLEAVQIHSAFFFDAYRNSAHHSALKGMTPADVHWDQPVHKLPQSFQLPKSLPITVGKVHFMRAVEENGHVKILNHDWEIPSAISHQAVWATLQFSLHQAKLRFYDAAPDAIRRTCLAEYPFPINEPVLPLAPEFQSVPRSPKRPWHRAAASHIGHWLSTMW